jgi:hypothetical protein
MANICWFEMRIRGTKDNCYAMVQSGIPCYDAYIEEEQGNDNDYMMYIRGECAWSVTNSMINIQEETLADKAKKYDLEIEICGLDESGDEKERFHYKGADVIKFNNLPSCFRACDIDQIGISAEEIKKFQLNEEHGMYVLKEEFVEKFEYDWEQGKAIFDFEISFDDLMKK